MQALAIFYSINILQKMKMPLEILRPAEVIIKRSGNIAHKSKSSLGVLSQSFCAQANTEVPEKV